MNATAHFISGLPRSGSTLLSSILRQNPRFSASMTSPIYSLWMPLLHKLSGASEFSMFINDEKRKRILQGILNAFYADQMSDVIFDTNRSWTGHLALIKSLYPQARIICCVRDIGWIINSIELMLRKNPLQTSRLFQFKPGGTVYARTETLMHPENGLVGLAWSNLRGAWFSEFAPSLIIMEYDTLVRHPDRTIRRLYDLIEAPRFTHDFGHVAADEPVYDAQLGMPGMHMVRARVEASEPKLSIPPDIFAKYKDASFWKMAELNTHGAAFI
ncbi:sulfotransferase family protein [Roseixanthobacter pseudopolyaromaticivorans]|uniref:sulfotransferase family protein n=1 Tax=Xanthobacteraceae TaxID=335928 RepID=UPI00372AF973